MCMETSGAAIIISLCFPTLQIASSIPVSLMPVYLSFPESCGLPRVHYSLRTASPEDTASANPTAGREGAAISQSSVPVQQRHSTAQRVPSTLSIGAGRMEDLFDHRQGSGTVEIASGREPNAAQCRIRSMKLICCEC